MSKDSARNTKYSTLDLWFMHRGYGWTDAFLRVDSQTVEMQVTHVFNDPLYEIARATVELIDDRQSSAFLWFEEPGTLAFELTRDQRAPLLHGRLSTFPDLFLERIPRDAQPLKTVNFTSHLGYWAALVQTSLCRSRELARHKLYPWREVQLPLEELAEIERYLRVSGA